MSTTILERNESGEVTLNQNMSFKVPRTMSAIGVIGTIACPLYDKDKVTNTCIIGADGVERPLLIKYPDNVSKPEIIDIRVLDSVKEAERLRWEIVEYIKKEVIPSYEEAYDQLLQARGGYLNISDNPEDPYPYQKYDVERSGSEKFLSHTWVKDRPKKKKNEELCRRYSEMEDVMEQAMSRLYNFNQIVFAAIKRSLPERYQMYKKMDSHIMEIQTNGRTYIYMWQHKLVEYYIPGPWSNVAPIEIFNF